jgi:hypothetical protein
VNKARILKFCEKHLFLQAIGTKACCDSLSLILRFFVCSPRLLIPWRWQFIVCLEILFSIICCTRGSHFFSQTVTVSFEVLRCTQNYWDFGLFPSSGVLGSRRTTFRKLEGREKTPQLGPLQRANLRDPIEVSSSRLHLRTETDPVSETSCFYS